MPAPQVTVTLDRLTSEAIDNYGNKQAYDNLLRLDGIIAAIAGGGGIQLARNNEVEIVTGGQPNFRERTLYGQNTNVAHRGKNAQITTVDDEGYTLISVPMRIIDGSIVYNQIERDQVAGNAAIAPDLVTDKWDQFADTWIQVIADALRQGTPGASDPYTLLPDGNTGTVNGILIDRTPAQQATDGATTAGLSRTDFSWWRNQYSNTSYDLTTTAGRRGLYLDVYATATRGNGPMFEPNVGVGARVIMASLGAAADNNRRGTYQDANGVMKLGYDNIMFYNARIVPDSSSRFLNGTAGKIALLNTRALRIKVLKGQGNALKGMFDQHNNLGSLPIFWKQGGKDVFENDIDTLNWVKVGYLTYNLVPKSLQDHGLADNCS